MMTVKEVSELTGISIRTLHHYDEIDLLEPTMTTEAGYRLYDEKALERLQTILLFKELEFPLREIKAILDNPGFDRNQALQEQIYLLEIKKKHIEKLLELARNSQIIGGKLIMDFSAFNQDEVKRYTEEAKKRWSDTNEYKEYERKNNNISEEVSVQKWSGLMEIFAEIGKLKDLSPKDEKVQRQIVKLQNYITDNFYTCSNEILKSLGQMYVANDEMKQNIDKVGGAGTAEFTHKAIEEYCK